MKKIFYAIFVVLLILKTAFADEGLWVPLFLKGYPIEQMQNKGLKLSAEDIYAINHVSLKDAIVQFGRGCTGSIISNQGLLITNYHCGYSFIVNHSSIEHDYLTNGFWAASMQEELPNPGLTATFLIYMEDVTDKILPEIPSDLNENKRNSLIENIIKHIVDSVEAHYHHKYEAQVKPFYYGNQYILIVTQTFRDIRLVAAPPSSIGKFGGETDNWMWPRHTGDFSIFRIYANKNNEPADYSPDNIPYRPKKFLKISLKGYKQGDFAMVIGFPGYTNEYAPSYVIANVLNNLDPNRIKIRQAKLDVLLPALNQNKKNRLMYAPKEARIANGWKKWKGEIYGLKRLSVLKRKKIFEHKFQNWANTHKNGIYKNVLNSYKKLIAQTAQYQKAYYYFIEIVYLNDVFRLAQKLKNQIDQLKTASSDQEFKQTKQDLIKTLKTFYSHHNLSVERKILNKTLNLYINNLDKKFVPNTLVTLNDIAKNAKCRYRKPQIGDVLFTKSVFLNKNLALELIEKLNKTTLKKLENDALIRLYSEFYLIFQIQTLPQISYYLEQIDSLNRVYMKAQMEFEPNKTFYPDANLTMRVSYGTIEPYQPKDAVFYNYFTTLRGVMEKNDSTNYDYRVPQKLLTLYQNKDYGRYMDKDSTLHVCFISNAHTTGGNSGSPVLDKNGNLIGLNFDRTWETTMSDYYYDPKICRNIIVDIRYVMFIIDKFAGQKRLINEMTFVE